MLETRINIRATEEEKLKAQQQADKLGLNISDYIKLIINLDAATNIIEKLKASQ